MKLVILLLKLFGYKNKKPFRKRKSLMNIILIHFNEGQPQMSRNSYEIKPLEITMRCISEVPS